MPGCRAFRARGPIFSKPSAATPAQPNSEAQAGSRQGHCDAADLARHRSANSPLSKPFENCSPSLKISSGPPSRA